MAVTALSVTATPGGVRSFTAKAAARPLGQITTLNVWATPGQLHTFIAKDVAPTEPPIEAPGGAPGGIGGTLGTWARGDAPGLEARRKRLLREQILREDEEIILIVMAALRTLH